MVFVYRVSSSVVLLIFFNISREGKLTIFRRLGTTVKVKKNSDKMKQSQILPYLHFIANFGNIISLNIRIPNFVVIFFYRKILVLFENTNKLT